MSSLNDQLAWQERELLALKSKQVIRGSAVPVVNTISQTFTFTLNEVVASFSSFTNYYGEFDIYFTPSNRGLQITLLTLYSSNATVGQPQDERFWQMPQNSNGKVGIHMLFQKEVPSGSTDRTVTVRVMATSTSGGTFSVS